MAASTPPLISCQSIAKSFGSRQLFSSLSLTVSEGERIGVVGPNGAGKSTLVAILAGHQEPDSGLVSFRRLARVGVAPQNPEFDPDLSVQQTLEAAVPPAALGEVTATNAIGILLGKVGFADPSQLAGSLSGGWRKRLAIAKELLLKPDVLLLDEPTNHLDIAGIEWLEGLLKSSPFASVIVSHDRYFLENVTSDMVEINRIYPNGLVRVKGTYSDFVLKRDEFLTTQAKQQEALSTKVRREVEWLRRGAKARTTKSKARIDSAGRLIQELGEVTSRNAKGSTQIDFSSTDRKSKKLVAATGIEKSLGGKKLFAGLGCTLSPGVRLGLVGANGTGKTTLLKILTGEMEPDAGEVERAEGLRAVYFDQNRELLDLNVPLRTALSPHGDSVIYQDRTIHVVSWAKRFLFRDDQLDVAVSRLSGGERARVLIARLMLQPADVLLLDEPTNDLDIPTLEVLEESLIEFTGALVLVTHDRYMLDRVSTAVMGLDGRGGANLFADYAQWEAYQDALESEKPAKPESANRSLAASSPKKRHSYMDAREWDQIEGRIADADAQVNELQGRLEDAETARDPKKLEQVYQRLQEARIKADQLYARWAELESKLR